MEPEHLRLRQCALAVSVLQEVDLLPTDDGIVLPGRVPVAVPWHVVRSAVAGADPGTQRGQIRLARWLRAARWVADTPVDVLAERARPFGLPADAWLHPGPDWVRERVLGGVLDLGLGLVGLDPAAPDAVVATPHTIFDTTGIDADPWPACRARLEETGALAAIRWRLDPSSPLRPMGDCDVVTLLGSARLRSDLVTDTGGMRAVAVPMRDRGWLDLRRIDPAFALAAAAATPRDRRGFPRPLLLTGDEVAMVAEGGRAARFALADPGLDPSPWTRSLRYR